LWLVRLIKSAHTNDFSKSKNQIGRLPGSDSPDLHTGGGGGTESAPTAPEKAILSQCSFEMGSDLTW